tara:strand:- start:1077 stop:1961 length:885 start_codon:yes stop_codon:yes gene_type:complete
MNREWLVTKTERGYRGRFKAMASPCEVLIDCDNKALAEKITSTVAAEAWRIESKFSRYRDDNIVYRINNAKGKTLEVDQETTHLIDFATHAYQISDRLFDLSSGVLRRLWRFDGGNHIPNPDDVAAILPIIGWHKVTWSPPYLTLLPGMEIDFGGIGKEYAVDKAAALVSSLSDVPVLVNFGGDLFANAPPSYQEHWLVGVENIGGLQSANIQLQRGGLATSGDARRFLLRDGLRYPHVLNPMTGWPVMDAPHSVTVATASCVEAGLLATLSMLQGKDAEDFIRAQEVLHWVQR